MARPRQYAGFWHQENDEDEKPIREVSVLMDLIKSSEINGEDLDLHHPLINSEDPPDCTAKTSSGELVGIEVTELVDGKHLTLDPKQWVDGRVAEWDSEKLHKLLARLLTSKDNKKYKGGPYRRIVVIIHTDEWGLYQEVDKLLDRSKLPGLKQIHEAYLLQSYDPSPGMKRCPYFRLV